MRTFINVGFATLLSLSSIGRVHSNAGVFTYYETPMFYRIGNEGYIQAHEPEVGFGPSQWRNIIFPPIVAPTGNQCGGIGQTTGYGQSPIVIPEHARDACDTDLSGYTFESGDCTWDDLLFRAVLNGVIVNATQESGCSLGRMKIPGNSNWFNALQFHIHTGSEHSVEGDEEQPTQYFPAELHIVHAEETMESFAVFGMFIDINPDDEEKDHDTFDYYLQGWEATERRVDEFCAKYPNGTAEWGPFSVYESRQMRLRCPVPGQGIDPEEVQWEQDTGMPVLKRPDYPVNNSIPHVYEDLPTPGYGIYAYRGGLTTPPYTEIVNWNLLDTPLYLSRSQLDRLYHVILCMTEPTTCKHATIANEAGLTNRPVQELHERTVIHRCEDGPPPPEGIAAVAVPVSPEYGYNHNQVRRCVLGGDGGPLQVCWVDTVFEHFALLFPWFAMALGMVVFYVLTRYVSWFPYTAMMFILGVIFGICSVVVDTTDQLSQSIRMWEDIGAEVVLLAFLPGLIFRDSYTSNVFLFQKALTQCLVMAFPMVLAGTFLTALVGYYILPYGWSFSFCMTFGAILSATDPVAVSALLNEVGAPPRLKIHISGESLLNDGSAIVFFTIFSQIFFSEFNIPGFGNAFNWGEGIALFFRMALGAVAIGVLFSAGLLGIVYLLNRKFNYEESIVQVMASITSVYLCYYTADAVCGTSGVLAVVTLGVITKFYSSSLFNDIAMMDKFWVLVEHMLNTVLFTLGGMVWGRIVSNQDPEHSITMHFNASDFGYFVLVWLLLIVIRCFLIAAFYPLIKRMGLGSNVKEGLFMGWAGLRGAVGIALAIHIDKHIHHQLFRTDPRRRYTTQLFGITGGVAFMTLVVNGTLSGPLLKYLGLAKTGESRQEVARTYHDVVAKKMFGYFLKLLGQPRFANVDYGAVKKHVTWFEDLSDSDIRYLVKRNKESTPVLHYNEPYLRSLRPFLAPDIFDDITSMAKPDRNSKLRAVFLMASAVGVTEKEREALRTYISKKKLVTKRLESGELEVGDDETEEESEVEASEHLIELRKVFIDLLDKAYDLLFETGEVEVRNVNMVVSYKTSVEVSRDHVATGHPIEDWDVVVKFMARREKWGQKLHLGNPNNPKLGAAGTSIKVKMDCDNVTNARDLIYYGSGFMEAHARAQLAFKSTSDGTILSDEMITVLEESQAQVAAAEGAIALIDKDRVTTILVHLVCQILLNKAGEWIGELNEQGMLKDQEAEHELESIQHDIDGITACHGEWILLPCGPDATDPSHRHGSTLDVDVSEYHEKADKLEAEKEELQRLLEIANEELKKIKESDKEDNTEENTESNKEEDVVCDTV